MIMILGTILYFCSFSFRGGEIWPFSGHSSLNVAPRMDVPILDLY